MLICNIIVRKLIQGVSLIRGSWYCYETSPYLEFFIKHVYFCYMQGSFEVVNYNYLYRFSWSILICKVIFSTVSTGIFWIKNNFVVLLLFSFTFKYADTCLVPNQMYNTQKTRTRLLLSCVFFSLDTEQFSVLKDCAAFFRVLKHETILAFILVPSKCVSTFH